MRHGVLLVALAVLALACAETSAAAAASGPAAPTVQKRYMDFINELVDLRQLAYLPALGETCKQFSSFDRESLNKEHWNANNDSGNFLRDDPEGKVLAEMNGPGVIHRIWSANPAGTLKIFIDGADKPVIKENFEQLMYGGKYPFVAPLVAIQARGASIYVPIPYQKSCKVVVENPGSMYYHVNYRTYPPGTQVESFHLPLTAEEKARLDAACTALKSCETYPLKLGQTATVEQRVEVKAGKTAVIARLTGPAALYQVRARVYSANKRQALRDVVLQITWDNHTPPSVWCPLGDFFGTSPGINKYASLPMGMAEDAYYSYWAMPFAHTALVELVNDGDLDVSVGYQIVYGPIRWGTNLGYFHAKWRRDNPCKTFDWPLLETHGRGRYCGVMLTVWNPDRGWWGEGDEKMWVDGESFPSTFGTGSEDYFGYAWCSTELFTNCYHNQTLCEGPGNGNYTSVNRWQITDNVPFQKSIKVTIENYGQDKDYTATVYWYATLDQKDSFRPVPHAGRAARPPAVALKSAQ
jgi:hypothetical protein